MVGVRIRGEQVRSFILETVVGHPRDIVRLTAERFQISRQAANQHLRRLVAQGALVPVGDTRARAYKLAPLVTWRNVYWIKPGLAEDVVWRDLKAQLGQVPDNVADIWFYAFTEMFNNALDHSGATTVTVSMEKTAAATDVAIFDDGVGIFRKIQNALSLLDARHAVLELAKGKFTTDPAKHSGEGIFFTSRVVDHFRILSGDVFFSHNFASPEDWILGDPTPNAEGEGTLVRMRLNNHTARKLKTIFDEFQDSEYAFTKTVVPVILASYGDENLVSRSQAKRLLARIDRFRVVIFDFEGVETIGHSFADEIFRVFPQNHPDLELHHTNTSAEVLAMITHARTGLLTE